MEDPFVIDAVAHAHNLLPENHRSEKHASAINEMVWDSHYSSSPPGYRVPKDEYYRDWQVDTAANMLFAESQTDIAVMHPTTINAFHDGYTSVEKAAEAKQRYPDRFFSYAAVDPLAGEDALEELERQVEEYDPDGLKLYPASWGSDGHYEKWRMDDPEVAFPVFEKAKELGIDVIAVHKALPLGPTRMETFEVGDVDGAVESFTDIDFEIVHGGMAFTEEVAWQLGRYPNVWVNLEGVNVMLMASERSFCEALAGLVSVGGQDAMDRICWGSGSFWVHPEPGLQKFINLDGFPDDIGSTGMVTQVPPLNDENKRKILAENYARLHDLDIEELKENAEGDEFSERSDMTPEGPKDPYGTTPIAQVE